MNGLAKAAAITLSLMRDLEEKVMSWLGLIKLHSTRRFELTIRAKKNCTQITHPIFSIISIRLNISNRHIVNLIETLIGELCYRQSFYSENSL